MTTIVRLNSMCSDTRYGLSFEYTTNAPSTASATTPAINAPDNQMRSRRRCSRSSAATKVTPTTTTKVTVTNRLPYSMRGWMLHEPVTRFLKQVGQSGQPSPDPVNRTAAPVRTMTIMERNEAKANQRKTGPVTGRRVRVGIFSD